MKTTSEKLAENLTYFTNNTKKRCALVVSSTQTKCKYSGTTVGIKTKGCFIGALLPHKVRVKADEIGVAGVKSLIYYANEGVYKIPSMIKDNEPLMSDFQALHDDNKYWNGEGLTIFGRDRLEEVVLKHDVLKLKDFKQFLK